MKRTNTKETRYARAQKLQEGLAKHFPKGKTISIGGVDYTPAVLTSQLQATIDTSKDTDTKKAAFHAAVEAEQEAQQNAQPALVGFPAYLYLTFGGSSEVLADFGLPARKRRVPTVQTKADAAAKARKTRGAAPAAPANEAPPPAVATAPAKTTTPAN
jgi:hypothetical protein